MEFIISNKKTVKAKAALKIRWMCEKEKMKKCINLIIFMIIMCSFSFFSNIKLGMFLCGAIIFVVVYGILTSIKFGRKYVSNSDGIKVTLDDEALKFGNDIYNYTEVDCITKVDNYIILFIRNHRKVIEVSDENCEQSQSMIKSIYSRRYTMNRNFTITNPGVATLNTKIKVWKNISGYLKYTFGFVRDILLISVVLTLFELKILDALMWTGFALGIYCVLFAVKVMVSDIKISKYLGISILFTDEYIVCFEKKILYTDINKVIFRGDYIIIKTQKASVVILCTKDNTEHISSVYDILYSKCTNIVSVIDTKKCKKRRIAQICGYLLIIGCISISEIILIIKYPATLSNYKDKFIEKYGIELLVLDEETNRGDYTFEKPYNKAVILDAVENIEKVLSRFPAEFWRELGENKTLKIIICDDIEPNINNGVSTSGLTSNMESQIYIYVDSGVYDTDETVAHEMFHAMTYALINENDTNKKIDDIIDCNKWNKYNPDEFVYGKKTSNYKGYFVSNNAKRNISEDMAETFKYLVFCEDELPSVYNAEAVKNKALFLIEWIDDNFEGVTEDAYWNRWFE